MDMIIFSYTKREEFRMNIGMTEIDVIAYFTREGQLRPLRFRVSESGSDENIVIPIGSVLSTDTSFYNGNLMHIFYCETYRNGIMNSYEIRYELKSNRWYLCRA